MSDRIKLSELVAGRGNQPYTPIGVARTMAADNVLIEIAQAALALRDARNPDDPELRELYFIALDKVQP